MDRGQFVRCAQTIRLTVLLDSPYTNMPPARLFRWQIIVCGLLLGCTSWLGAQEPAAEAPPAAPAVTAPAPVVVPERPAGEYPPSPVAFYRGSDPTNPNAAGFYFNLVVFVPVLGWLFLFAYTTNWVNEDARPLRMRVALWNSLVMAGGTLGLLAILLMGNAFGGTIGLLAFHGTPLGYYIFERNKRVPESGKVLTPQHLKRVGIQLLSKMGIQIGGKEISHASGGPPIRFIGKARHGKGFDPKVSRQVENSRGYLLRKR